MQTITSVTVAPEVTRLVTLDRVKAELGVTDDTSDELLGPKIDEASSDIESHIGRVLSRATLTQTFWDEGWTDYFVLDRYPVASITSVTVDDVEVDADEYRLDAATGLLYRLDASGYPCVWSWCKAVVVVFAAGYLLPGEDGRDLPYAIEGAAIDLVTSYWINRGRDRTVKSESVPGLGEVSYWVGSIGASGQLPPGVVTKISPFRRGAL